MFDMVLCVRYTAWSNEAAGIQDTTIVANYECAVSANERLLTVYLQRHDRMVVYAIGKPFAP
jgi:hypothetical protein